MAVARITKYNNTILINNNSNKTNININVKDNKINNDDLSADNNSNNMVMMMEDYDHIDHHCLRISSRKKKTKR